MFNICSTKLQRPDRSPFEIDSSSRQHVPIPGCKSSDTEQMARRTIRVDTASSQFSSNASPSVGLHNLKHMSGSIACQAPVDVKLRYLSSFVVPRTNAHPSRLSTPDDRLQLRLAMTRAVPLLKGTSSIKDHTGMLSLANAPRKPNCIH